MIYAHHTLTVLSSFLRKVHTHTTILRLFGFCPGQPRWAGTRRNIHPLTSSWSSIIPICFLRLLRSMASSLFSPHALQSFPQSLSKFSLVYLLAWHRSLHTPYVSEKSNNTRISSNVTNLTRSGDKIVKWDSWKCFNRLVFKSFLITVKKWWTLPYIYQSYSKKYHQFKPQ